MTYKYCCVVDANGAYKTAVLVLGEAVQHYTLGNDERLIDSAPPACRTCAGGAGFVRPRWEGARWTEGADEAEITAWEAEHPAPAHTLSDSERMDALEELVAGLLFGGGGEAV